MMRDTIRAFVDKEVTPFIRKNWEREWDMKPENRPSRELLEGAHRIGVRTLGIPEEFGGRRSIRDRSADLRAGGRGALARATPASPTSSCRYGRSASYSRTSRRATCRSAGFRQIAEDPSFLLAHCLTEPRGASDRWLPYDVPEAMMHTRATLKGDKWVINGRKQFITNGYDAKLYVVYARRSRARASPRGPRASSCRAIPRASPSRAATRHWAAVS